MVVLTRRVDEVVAPALRWFVIAAVGTLLVAVVVAVRMASRLTAPLRATEAATRRMAGGDLAARVPAVGQRDEVADVAAAVNAMAAALERARGAERAFLLSVSHDLATPLTAIRGWSEALADGAVEDPRAAGQVLEAAARRLERLVTDLIELARLQTRRFPLRVEPIPVVEVAGEVVTAAGPGAQAQGVDLALSDLDGAGPGRPRRS